MMEVEGCITHYRQPKVRVLPMAFTAAHSTQLSQSPWQQADCYRSRRRLSRANTPVDEAEDAMRGLGQAQPAGDRRSETACPTVATTPHQAARPRGCGGPSWLVISIRVPSRPNVRRAPPTADQARPGVGRRWRQRPGTLQAVSKPAGTVPDLRSPRSKLGLSLSPSRF